MWKIHQKKKSNITSSYRRLTYIYCFLLNNVKNFSFFFSFFLSFLLTVDQKKKKKTDIESVIRADKYAKADFQLQIQFLQKQRAPTKKKTHLLLHSEAKRGSLGVRARVEDEVKNDLSPSFIQFFMKCHLFVPQHQKRRPKINTSSDPAVKSVASVPFFLFQPERVFRA